LEDLGVDERIILGCTLKEYGGCGLHLYDSEWEPVADHRERGKKQRSIKIWEYFY
jgi:hypothetical protein